MEKRSYLDFHTHILPGIDDGAKDWDMTKKMLEEEHKQGVSTIIATPHSYPGRGQDVAKIKSLCEEANDIAKKIDENMKILTGNEIYFRGSIVEELEKGEVLPLADSRYLLIEFSPGESYEIIYHGLKELIETGYYPVLAHMERIYSVFGKEKHLEELVELGCYIQVNCESFIGGMFDKTSSKLRKFIGYGYIHFLGSDCHNMESRKPLMGDCATKLIKKLGSEGMDKILYQNPVRFFENKFI